MAKKVYIEPQTEVAKFLSSHLMALAEGTLSHISGGSGNAPERRTQVF